ncbi:T9SS type A sorting domain-containing protein [Calditrichota bacterium LG25]
MKKALFILCFMLGSYFTSHAASKFMNNPFRNMVLMDGNAIKVPVYNFGIFSNAGNHSTDFVWKGLGYAYEFFYFIGAEVPVADSSHVDAFPVTESDSTVWMAHVISEGSCSRGRELNPEQTMIWGFQPIWQGYDGTVYFDQNNFPHLPTSAGTDANLDGRPDIWPAEWLNPQTQEYLWPGLWQNGQIIGDLETLYGLNDYDNLEFAYFPFPEDSNRRGLGIEIQSHVFQVQDFYQDILFVVLRLTNRSSRDLNKMIFGIMGDVHIGGWQDYKDDHYNYDVQNNLIYAYDTDGKSYGSNIAPGYFGITFLQTPGISNDGLDNDGDGLIDESQWDGIDNDGDWNPENDDLGADGLANTNDPGEGDGLPTVGEPNFEWKDMDEADMLGLTSAVFPSFGDIFVRDDEKLWQNTIPGTFEQNAPVGDYWMIGGSAYFSLNAGQTIQVGFAFVFGQTLTELKENCQRAQRFYRYRLGSFIPKQNFPLTSLLANKTFTEAIPLKWTQDALSPEANIECALSPDDGRTWLAVEENIANVGAYALNISDFKSWPFYKMRIRAFDKGAYYKYQSKDYFAIDNSKEENAPPGLIVFLDDNVTLSKTTTLHWLARDVESDALQLRLIIQSAIITDTLRLHGDSLALNTYRYPNGSYRFIFEASDGENTTTETRNVFIQNTYDLAQSNLITHLKGHATGRISVQLINSNQFRYHLYKITFNQHNNDIFYSVLDSTTGQILIENDPLPSPSQAGRTFNGFRLCFENDDSGLNTAQTGWNDEAKTNLQFKLFPHEILGIFPYDIQIRFFDHVVDTSNNQVLLNFKADNLTLNKPLNVHVFQKNPDSVHWQPEDPFSLFEKDSIKTVRLWGLIGEFPDNEAPIAPASGDTFTIVTTKSFTDQDIYLFDASPLTAIQNEAPWPMNFSLEQNYPNPFNPQTTIPFQISRTCRVQLVIYNILGQKVQTLIDRILEPGHHTVVFNGQNLASGIYWVRLKADGQVKTKKMILIK